MTSAAATITPVATSSVRKTLLLQTTVALVLSLAIGLLGGFSLSVLAQETSQRAVH
jgi:hypothetical protein